jgi:hypothetical protein
MDKSYKEVLGSGFMKAKNHDSFQVKGLIYDSKAGLYYSKEHALLYDQVTFCNPSYI